MMMAASQIKFSIKDESTKVKSSNPNIYQLQMTEHKSTPDIRIMSIGEMNPDVQTKRILTVGHTGSGKTTMINSMINYVYGVEYEDDFRFMILPDPGERMQTDETKGKTSCINVYKIGHQRGMKIDFNLILIDTPGFGDEKGLEHDEQIAKQIEDLFVKEDNGVSTLSCVAFVVKASTVRLTATEQYIFDCVLHLFGKDIEECITMMVSFVDDLKGKPKVVNALKAGEIPYRKFYKFNNSDLDLEKNESRQSSSENDSEDSAGSSKEIVDIKQQFFKLSSRNFKNFFKDIGNLEEKSLQLTKMNLQIRESLKAIIEGLKQDVQNAVNQMNIVEQESNAVLAHSRDLELNKNFEYKVAEKKVVSIKLDPGTYVTNCLVCNQTCHYPCGIPDDGQKYNCDAMQTDFSLPLPDFFNSGSPQSTNRQINQHLFTGLSFVSSFFLQPDISQGTQERSSENNYEHIKCMICPGKCVWHRHKNMSYRLEVQTQTVKKTSEDLKNKFLASGEEFKSAFQIFEKTIQSLFGIQKTALKKINQIMEAKNILRQIALKPSLFTSADYVDKMIRCEEEQKKTGWKERIIQYKNLKEKIELLSKIETGNIPTKEIFQKTKFDVIERAKRLNVGEDVIEKISSSIDKVIDSSQ